MPGTLAGACLASRPRGASTSPPPGSSRSSSEERGGALSAPYRWRPVRPQGAEACRRDPCLWDRASSHSAVDPDGGIPRRAGGG